MDEARRFIALAHELNAPYVRVFPNQFVPGEDKRVTFARISDGLHELGEYARPAGVTIIVESHGEFRRGEDIVPILEGAKSKNVAFLWDAHHTCVEGEKPTDTFQQLGKYTRHTHLKDSVPIPGKPKEDRQYVLTGTGNIPVRRPCGCSPTMGRRATTASNGKNAGIPRSRSRKLRFRTTQKRCGTI
jgi:sugar phosphate isomerase/epimerase